MSPLALLWLFSTLLAYANKLPFISKIITGLQLWYGRTTWWQVLVKARKLFLVFNALIGLYTMIKITGFSTDNIIAGIYGLGANYTEMVISFFKKMFNWFYNFLNNFFYPKPSPQAYHWEWWKWNKMPNRRWELRELSNDPLETVHNLSRREKQNIYKGPFGWNLYKNPFNWFSSSDSWIPSWLWYAGVTILTVGTLFVGYKLVTDPGYITDLNERKKGPTDGDITLLDARTGADVTTPVPNVTPQTTGVVTEAAKAFTENQCHQENHKCFKPIKLLYNTR